MLISGESGARGCVQCRAGVFARVALAPRKSKIRDGDTEEAHMLFSEVGPLKPSFGLSGEVLLSVGWQHATV